MFWSKENYKIEIQHDSTDCGPACLYSVYRHYKGSISIERIRELSGKNKKGTTLLGLYQAALEIDFNAMGCLINTDYLIKHNKPTILHVQIDNELEHYVVFFSFKNNSFIIGDPSKGIIYLSKEELESIWKSKACLILEPNIRFNNKRQKNANKLKLILDLLKPHKYILLIIIFIGTIISTLSLASYVFTQLLIDEIIPNKNLKLLFTSIVALLMLQILRTLLNALRNHLVLNLSKIFSENILINFYDLVLSLKINFFDIRKTGDIVTRITDTKRIQNFIFYFFSSTIIEIWIVIVSIIALFYYLIPIGILTIIFLPLYYILIHSENKKIISKQHDVMSKYANVESDFINNIKNIYTIKSFCLEKKTLQKARNKYLDYLETSIELGIININFGVKTNVLGTFMIGSIISLSSYYLYKNYLTTGELIAIISIISTLLPVVSNLANLTFIYNESRVALDRIYEVSEYTKEDKNEYDFPSDINEISIKNINFRYPGSKLVLENFTIKLTKGKLFALFGESGTGKSTLSKILGRFYIIESGNIYINNESIYSISLTKWRKSFISVPQEVNLFDGTIIENVLLNDLNDSEIINFKEFCKIYGFDYYFNRLPSGLNTLVGENGINLSGGQKQILAIARALYKKPKVLILDEATSALDTDAENFVLNILKNLKNDSIILFITHKKYLSNYFDEIFYM